MTKFQQEVLKAIQGNPGQSQAFLAFLVATKTQTFARIAAILAEQGLVYRDADKWWPNEQREGEGRIVDQGGNKGGAPPPIHPEREMAELEHGPAKCDAQRGIDALAGRIGDYGLRHSARGT